MKLHVSDNSSVHHQEFFTVHAAMVYVIQVCWRLASRIRMEHPDPARKLSAKLYDIYHCCVYSEKLLMMEQRNCPKHVEFHSKNKFEKLVHIVGLIIRNLTRCTVTWTSESLIRLLYHCFSIHEEVNGFERCNRKILADWRFINWDWIFCVLSAVLQCLFLHETKEDLLNYFS